MKLEQVIRLLELTDIDYYMTLLKRCVLSQLILVDNFSTVAAHLGS